MKPSRVPEPHSFREKVFRKRKVCGACREPVEAQGLLCRVCKVASHKRCEAKVASPCQGLPPPELRRNTAPVRRSENLGSTKSLSSSRQRSTLPRSFSLERVMERPLDLDVTYVTERIIAVSFPAALPEGPFRARLRDVALLLASRHRDKYMLFNLSEKRRDIARLHPKVQDFGWPDLHAPPLDRLCSICKAMEGWLRAHPQHAAVLHCKGSKGRTGVIVAAYMHYSKISASAEQALGTLTMRKFCEEKAAPALQPSQRRYIDYFSGLLSGGIRMNSSPLFLHHVLLPALPGFEPGAPFQPFLKIYQSMQLVYTSGVYSTTGTQSLCITLEPALLLKGDVMVRCYHRQRGGAGRVGVFRVQFHTCTVHGPRLWFGKDELDEAWRDERFPFEASVEFVFSSSPEKIKGWDSVRNSPGVTVDYSVREPAVRWDSYEGFNVRHEDSLEELPHTPGPLDGSPYARVQRPPSARAATAAPDATDVPDVPDAAAQRRPPPPTAAERRELELLLGGFGVRPPEGSERPPAQGGPRGGPEPAGSASPPGTPRARADGTAEASPGSSTTSGTSPGPGTGSELRREERAPRCACPRCRGPELAAAALHGLRLQREGPPACPAEVAACPRCGRRGPPAPGYEALALEAREGYGIPGRPEPLRVPSERRSPGEGGPWRGTSEGPSSPEPPADSPEGARGSPGSPTPAFPPAAALDAPSPGPQPPLPEKRHPPGSPPGSPGPEPWAGDPAGVPAAPGTVPFVQDTSKFWYKPGLSREQAIAVLKDKEPGAFLIRDSSSFQGAYGLALKVATPPPNCVTHSKGDPQEQLVRHFLVETGPRGVKIKGCPQEPHFGSLPALVLHHSISPISLPCALRIPSHDPLEGGLEAPVPPNMSTAADLLRQGAACSVLYLSSVDTESLTGPQAVAKATGTVLGASPRPPPCTVHFKVSAQGITLTDNQRKLFFRRHYPVGNVTYCSTDPQDRRWANPDGTTSKIFGFVAKKPGGPCANACHVFAELDPEQPAAAIVTFVTKVMLGTHRK